MDLEKKIFYIFLLVWRELWMGGCGGWKGERKEKGDGMGGKSRGEDGRGGVVKLSFHFQKS